ncbi:MAG: ribosome-associated translation inhibitor RaiA [bacterium]|nr:ribosome-associated translation inhibitor RaiA [bacterium]
MHVAVRGKHLEENEALENHALEKAKKLSRFAKDITRLEIELISEPAHLKKEEDYIVDVTLHVSGHTFQIRDSENDMYKAIDKAIERMIETLRRRKEKEVLEPRRKQSQEKRKLPVDLA